MVVVVRLLQTTTAATTCWTAALRRLLRHYDRDAAVPQLVAVCEQRRGRSSEWAAALAADWGEGAVYRLSFAPDSGAQAVFVPADEDGDSAAARLAIDLGAPMLLLLSNAPVEEALLFSSDPSLLPAARVVRRCRLREALQIISHSSSDRIAVASPATLSLLQRAKCDVLLLLLAAVGEAEQEDGGAAPWLRNASLLVCAKQDRADVRPQPASVCVRRGVSVISMETVDMWRQAGHLQGLLQCFSAVGVSLDLVATSQTNVTVSLDPPEPAPCQLQQLTEKLSLLCKPKIIRNCAVISLVGYQVRRMLATIASSVLAHFTDKELYIISQAASDTVFSLVCSDMEAGRVAHRMHKATITSLASADAADVLGATCGELRDGTALLKPLQQPQEDEQQMGKGMWWSLPAARAELLRLATEATPLYVYNTDVIKDAAARVKAIAAIDRPFFAIKANPNPAVLATLHQAGIGFECVSPGELRHVLQLFPDIDASREVLFTPNFAARAEFEEAVRLGVHVTVDCLYPLQEWGEVFHGVELMLRLDPGQGTQSKFGIALSDVAEAKRLTETCGATVTGLHCHVGSGILDASTWMETAHFLESVGRQFPKLRHLDLGGGLGVVEKSGQTPLDLRLIDAQLRQFKQQFPHYGVDAGFNSLLRPTMYGSFHFITNLTRLYEDEAPTVKAHVVGPICETGDVLGHDRTLREPRCGDVLLVATAGAYGHSMSSHYNMRPPAIEVVLKPTAFTS